MAISLALKTFKLIIIIMNFSYFIGMLWLTMCNTIQDIYHGSENDLEDDILIDVVGHSLLKEAKGTNFLEYHSITDFSNRE